MEEKNVFKMEFLVVKKNFLEVNKQYEEEKAKNQNIGLELINSINENKALHDEINDIYKKTGSTSEENDRFLKKI